MELKDYDMTDPPGMNPEDRCEHWKRMIERAQKDLAEHKERISKKFEEIATIRAKNEATKLKLLERKMQLKADMTFEGASLDDMMATQEQFMRQFDCLVVQKEKHERQIELMERQRKQLAEKYSPGGLYRMRKAAEEKRIKHAAKQKEMTKKLEDSWRARRDVEAKLEATKTYYQHTISDLTEKIAAAKRQLLEKKFTKKMAKLREARRKK